MFGKVKELMEMKKEADRIKKELDAIVLDVEDVRGIQVRISGSQEFLDLTINEEYYNKTDRTRLQKDLLRAVNAAMKKAQKTAAMKMASQMKL